MARPSTPFCPGRTRRRERAACKYLLSSAAVSVASVRLLGGAASRFAAGAFGPFENVARGHGPGNPGDFLAAFEQQHGGDAADGQTRGQLGGFVRIELEK